MPFYSGHCIHRGTSHSQLLMSETGELFYSHILISANPAPEYACLWPLRTWTYFLSCLLWRFQSQSTLPLPILSQLSPAIVPAAFILSLSPVHTTHCCNHHLCKKRQPCLDPCFRFHLSRASQSKEKRFCARLCRHWPHPPQPHLEGCFPSHNLLFSGVLTKAESVLATVASANPDDPSTWLWLRLVSWLKYNFLRES